MWASASALHVQRRVLLFAGQNPTLQGHPEDYPRADIEYGARLYARQCVDCHGDSGDGVAGVDFRSGKFRTAANDLQLRTVITNGFPNTGMPAFKFDRTELTGIVAYLRNMNTSTPARSKRATRRAARRVRRQGRVPELSSRRTTSATGRRPNCRTSARTEARDRSSDRCGTRAAR